MKNWKRYFALMLMLCFAVALVPVEAHADALSAAMIGMATYGVAQAAGINFSAMNMTGQGITDFMTAQVEDYVSNNGGSITSIFGSEALRVTAGKLVIPATIYNSILDVISWVEGKFGINTDNTPLEVDGKNVTSDTFGSLTYRLDYDGSYWVMLISNNGQQVTKNTTRLTDWVQPTTLEKTARQTGVGSPTYVIGWQQWFASDTGYTTSEGVSTTLTVGSMFQWTKKSDYVAPQPIPAGKDWAGDFSQTPGWEDAQDVPDFLPQIPEAIANNDIIVQGEVLDDEVIDPEPTTEPQPTTAPTYPPIDDVLGGLGEIGGTLDGINDTVGTIEQTLEGVGENVGELEQTITEALEVPDVEDIELHKFDLKGLFPFCIPFDLHAIISAFSTDPVTPSVSIPFNIPSIGLQYTFNLDLHDFDGLAQVLRTLEFIAFGVGLLFVTGKVIKW